ncbi:MAG: NAD-dependent epimerase/dehydratase family protein [Bacteroidota bacterium]
MTERDDNGRGPVLLTGATGFVGSRVARRLAQAGSRVRAIVRAKGAPELADPDVAPWIDEIEGDFTRPETAAAAARGVDAVVHCAATAGPDMETARHVNVEGTRSMVEAARAAGVLRYVHVSTLSVYARTSLETMDESAPIKEEGDPYGLTKAEADRVVLESMERGLSSVIFRPGAILGFHRTSTWAVRMPRRIRDRQMKLRGDGRETIPWLHVDDLADTVLLALEDDRAVGRIYDMTDGAVTWRDYTDEVRGWFGAPPLESIPEAEIGGYSTARFEAGRVRRELGYRPRRDYASGMAEAAAYWARENAAHGS